MRDPARILLVRTDRLGETLLNAPMLPALRAAFLKSRITWMVDEGLVELLRHVEGADDVVGVPAAGGPWWRRAWKLGQAWRRGRYDAIIVSNASKELHLAAWLAGVPIRLGYDRKWAFLLTHRVPDRRPLGEIHEVEYNMKLLSAVGVAAPAVPVLHLSVSGDAERSLARLLADADLAPQDQLVAVHPWTSNPRKQWPPDRFRALLGWLCGMPRVRPVLIGGPEAAALAGDVLPPATRAVINLAGRLSLPELAACLARAKVLVTNDSGPMHVAAAVGTPVVALFGTTEAGSQPRRWGPWGPGHTIIQKPLEQISVEEVAAAVQPHVSHVAEAHSHR